MTSPTDVHRALATHAARGEGGGNSFGLIRAPGTVVFGRGMVKAAGEYAAACGTRAFICTDAHVRRMPGFDVLVKSLADGGMMVSVYDGVLAEVPIDGVTSAAEAARRFAPDVIVAFGGGSSIDLAKLTSLILTFSGRLPDYYGENRVPGPILPVVAIPTTAGTGSEVTPVAVLTDPEREMKVGVASTYLVPRYAICDPDLTDSCPPTVTAHAGIDALAHAIEAYTATAREADASLLTDRVFVGKNRLSDTFALSAIASIDRSFVRAVHDGSDRAARDSMALGSLLAGLAFGTAGTAAAHALQYPIGASTRTSHGVGVGVLLQYVMAFNVPAATEPFADIGRVMGCDPSLSSNRAADFAVERVAQLASEVGIPRTIRDLDVALKDLDRFAEQANTITRLVENNPRSLDAPSLAAILRAAWRGSWNDATDELDGSEA